MFNGSSDLPSHASVLELPDSFWALAVEMVELVGAERKSYGSWVRDLRWLISEVEI
jgi:hypothetical protein